MLYKTYVINKSSREYVPYEKSVTVTENKAPTDESVRLLNEFQEKAKENIVANIRVEGNELNGVLVVFQREPCMRDYDMAIKFTLNGRDYTAKLELNHEDLHFLSKSEHHGLSPFRDYLAEKMSLAIAEQIIDKIHLTIKQ